MKEGGREEPLSSAHLIPMCHQHEIGSLRDVLCVPHTLLRQTLHLHQIDCFISAAARTSHVSWRTELDILALVRTPALHLGGDCGVIVALVICSKHTYVTEMRSAEGARL